MDAYGLKATAKAATDESHRWMEKFISETGKALEDLREAVDGRLKSSLSETEELLVRREAEIGAAVGEKLDALRADVRRIGEERDAAFRQQIESVRAEMRAEVSQAVSDVRAAVTSEIAEAARGLTAELVSRFERANRE